MKTALLSGIVILSLAFGARAYTLSSADVQNMATSSANFQDANSHVPNYVTAPNGSQLSPSEFFYVMSRWLVAGNSTYVYQGVGEAPAPSGSVTNGTITQADLISACQAVNSFVNSYGRLPNFVTVNSAHVSLAVFDYVLAKTIRFFQANGRLPNYTTIAPCADPAAWSIYVPLAKSFFILGTDAQSYGLQNVVNKAATNGIRDILLLIKGTSGVYNFSNLAGILPLAHAQGMRVHAWVACFHDTQAYNSGLYSSVASGWINPADTNYQNYLLNSVIVPALSNYATDGILLDYVRYPGNANGNTTPINNFLAAVRTKANALAPSTLLTAAVMPEMSANAQAYGQDYGQMSQYLDAELPMTYTYEFGQPATWIGTVVDYLLARVASSCNVQAIVQSKNGSSDKSASAMTNERSIAESHGSAVNVSYFDWPFSASQWTSIAQ